MEFQLSVFIKGHYSSYQVSTSDKKSFHFLQKSAPPALAHLPKEFILQKQNKRWVVTQPLEPLFKKALLQQLKAQLV